MAGTLPEGTAARNTRPEPATSALSWHMTRQEPDLLALLEHDMSLETATHFTALAAEYLAETRDREGAVSTGRYVERDRRAVRRADAARRQPLEGDRRATARRRAAGLQSALSPALRRPSGVAAAPGGDLDGAVIAALNQSLAVAEMSPVATVIEHRVIRWMCELAGFGAAAGGTLTSGGTEATFTALLAARAARIPDAWTNGVGADPPVVVCGEHAHYAVDARRRRAGARPAQRRRRAVARLADGHRGAARRRSTRSPRRGAR